MFVTLGNTTNLKRKKRKEKKIHSTVSKCFNLWQYGIGLRMSRIGQWPEIVMHDWKNPHLVTLILLLAQASASRARSAEPNCKNPPKMRFQKFVKLTDHTCACNDLTNFECEGQATGNGSCENFQKLALKIS